MRRPALVYAGIALIVVFGGMALMVNDYLGWQRAGYTVSKLVTYFGAGFACIAIGWWPLGTVPRVLLGVIGAALLLYGLSSITGGWFGVIPWKVSGRWWVVAVELVAVGVVLIAVAVWPRYYETPTE